MITEDACKVKGHGLYQKLACPRQQKTAHVGGSGKFGKLLQSGRRDLNPGPLQPHCSALAWLRHAPNETDYTRLRGGWQIAGVHGPDFRITYDNESPGYTESPLTPTGSHSINP